MAGLALGDPETVIKIFAKPLRKIKNKIKICELEPNAMTSLLNEPLRLMWQIFSNAIV